MKHSETDPGIPHDLDLPDWGPYSKSHLGVSHIADAGNGLRLDLVPSPGIFRGKLCIPSALWDSDAWPSFATADLRHYRNAHEIAGRERITATIDYIQDKDQVDVSARFDNRSPEPVACTLRSFVSLRFPNEFVRDATPLSPAEPQLPERSVFIEATDYERLELTDAKRAYGIVSDAKRRGVFRESGFVYGAGLGAPFGERGDSVVWRVNTESRFEYARCTIRYRCPEAVSVRLRVFSESHGIPSDARLSPADSLTLCTVDLAGSLPAGVTTLSLEVLEGSGLEIDSCTITESGTKTDPQTESGRGNPPYAAPVSFTTTLPVARPTLGVVTADGSVEAAEAWWRRPLSEKRRARGVTLDYPEVKGVYLLVWDCEEGRVRTVRHSEIDMFMRKLVHEHVSDTLIGDNKGEFTDIALEPLAVPAGESRTVTMRLLRCGTHDELHAHINRFRTSTDHKGTEDHRGDHRGAEVGRERHNGTEGERRAPVATGAARTHAADIRRVGRDMLAATLLTNVAYPIHTKWGFIRSNTPGRWWDSLYTWDNGFIGIGLSVLDFARARDCLLAYLTEPDDPDAPYVQHGSPLPVQIYLYRELWNRYHDKALERYAYPRLKRMYEFLVGRAEGSPTQPFESGLVTTWELFYNSGGWDDYPPQVHVHYEGLEDRVAPVVSTSHIIRAARLLRSHAERLGLSDDIAMYEDDVDRLSGALQRHARDDDSGFFGYVRHDVAGNPVGILRHESGENFNRGLDGLSPFVAGVCSNEQRARTVELLMSPQRLWTEIGVSTVDQSAPYFRDDGYWNGAVWMPHQWFFWKSLIDYGYIGHALRIAGTALDLWGREVAESKRCFEHFPIKGARGAGWHQFGGLSAPVVAWYESLHVPGTITPGYEVRVDSHEYDEERGLLEVELQNESHEPRSILLCLAERNDIFRVLPETVRAEPHEVSGRGGVCALTLPGNYCGKIRVQTAE